MTTQILCTVGTVNIVLSSALESVDNAVWEMFVNNPFLLSAARIVTSFGVLSVLLPLAVVSGFFLWITTKSGLVAVTPWIVVQVNSIVVASLKDWTAVARPPREFWVVEASAGSFPSGHVANTTALVVITALLFSQLFPHRSRIFYTSGIVVCFAMGWSRLALNVHWLSDVIAGWFVGAATAFVVLQGVQRLKSQRESQLQTRD